jgi:hypothetical protein
MKVRRLLYHARRAALHGMRINLAERHEIGGAADRGHK